MRKVQFIPFLLLTFVCIMTILPQPFGVWAEDYKVGQGDVLDIKVYENNDLNSTLRVSSDGTIRVSLIGEISVMGMTVSQISNEIEKRLADGYLIHPQVDVFIKEHKSKQAVILGEIRNPGQYEITGQVTFLEFISKAGGLTSSAGTRAVIKRSSIKKGESDRIVIDLEKLIKKGDTSLNLEIQDNDNIYISRAETYYVSGEVNKPNSYNYTPDVTVIKAITKAGGFSKIAARNKVKIIRTINGENKILEKVSMDTPVQPEDVIVIPESLW